MKILNTLEKANQGIFQDTTLRVIGKNSNNHNNASNNSNSNNSNNNAGNTNQTAANQNNSSHTNTTNNTNSTAGPKAIPTPNNNEYHLVRYISWVYRASQNGVIRGLYKHANYTANA